MLAKAARTIYASSGCEIDIARRELRVSGSPVPLGARAFEILEVLAETAGALVTKRELMERVWRGAIVGDTALQVHVSALRKALGPRRAMLRTESGRGYRLLGSWTTQHQTPPAPPPASRQPREIRERQATNIPQVTALIGRAAAIERLRDLLSAYRMLTLTGAGGIGKSTLALHAAHAVLSDFADGGWLVELASLSDPSLVPSAVTGVLDLNLGSAEISANAVARAISHRNFLLVLDNCEHVIDAAANLAESLLRLCPRITILATSREVLRIAGECVYRVSPLEVPTAEEGGADHILGHSAVELFVTRARESSSEMAPGVEDLFSVAAICRHLDGMPLAIEFAAARAALIGVGHVAADLENRFALLTSRRRTALPRHQTLHATLDWSYGLLHQAEQQLLCRLAAFSGGFTLDAAEAVMANAESDPSAVINEIANLVNKSLITLEDSALAQRWRLLETTRVYGLEKLEESGEAQQVARLHAKFYLAFFSPFAAEAQLQTAIDDIDRYRREIDNLRAALNWAFSADGDSALGVELAAVATDFWAAASLVGEGCEWTGKALAQIGAASGTRYEMVLQCSLGVGLIYLQGMIVPAHKALTQALALSQQLADFDYEQRATQGLWLFSGRGGLLNDALLLALRYEEAARSRDPQAQSVADWFIGVPQIYLGAHIEATDRLQRAINSYPAERRRGDLVRFGADLRAAAFGHLGATLLSQGLLDAASRAAISAIEEARGADNPTVLCMALAWAVSIVLLSLGNLDAAELYANELIDHAYKHAMRPFYAAGHCVRGSLAAKRGHPENGIESFRSGLAEMREARYLLFYPYFLTDFAAVLGAVGRADEGLVQIDEALGLALEIDYRWFLPEIWRTEGDLLARHGADGSASVITDLFHKSMSLAREQQALYWELSAALSLAEFMRDQGRDREARAVLAPVYGRFTEGFSSSKMKEARALLDQLS